MTTDPMAMYRDWLGQWEKLANEHGAAFLARPEVAQAMGGTTAAGLQAKQAMQDGMAKFLAATNLPSKADFDALAGRIAGIEAVLARIEVRLGPVGDARQSAAPKPRRTRTPAS